MADVDPGATDVVCVPEMSDEERESYSEYVQENLKNQDLQRSDIKDPVALGESNQKLQQLSDKVSVIEKRLGEELAKGDKEKEKKFFEKGFSQVVIDKILFPGGVKLNYITPEAMGVQSLKDKVVSEILTALGLGANPAQALKKIVSDKTLSMVVDSMSNPEQLYSMAGSYASSTATAIAKYEKRQKVLSDVNQESVEINENIKKSEARLQSLEGKSKQIQEQIDILNEKKKASGAEAIVRGEKIKTEAFLEAQKLKVAKEEELDKKQKVKEELEVKLTQNEAKVENHRKDFASKEKELEKANQTLKERENPGWISWMAGYGTPESIAEAREEVETASETKTASQQEFTKAQDESNRLQTEIGNLEDELIEEEAKLRRPFNFELSAADLKNLEQQVIEEVNEELTVLEQEMLELSQHVDGENTQLKSLKTDKENLQTSLSKANTKLSKVSYVVERQVTDEMLIANLIGKKEAPAGVKEDIKQASLSLLQLTAPKTALILGSLGQLSGYDELYADQVETYLSRTLNQFAFQMDERALAKGYEQLADTLSAKRASFKAPLEDEGVSASEAEDSKTEASKTEVPEIEGPKVDTREQLRNDTNKIIEFYMGSTPAFVTQHVASSVNEAYNLFQNPALNRLLICQLLAGMAKAVEETQSQQVA
jgi:hypothetical protein